MIRHIVFFKFKPGTTDAQIDKLAEGLMGLPARIAEIKGFECGRDLIHSERSFDFALNSAFADMEALQRYQVHPDHQQVVAYVREISEKVVAVDYEF